MPKIKIMIEVEAVFLDGNEMPKVELKFRSEPSSVGGIGWRMEATGCKAADIIFASPWS